MLGGPFCVPPMYIALLHVEVGEAGLSAVVESARTGELSPIAWVVLRNLAMDAKRAMREHESKVRAAKPRPISIREEWRKAA